MFRSIRLNVSRLAACAVVLLAVGSPGVSHGQAAKTATDHTDSRVDIYGGYGYFHPLNSGINGYQYQDVSTPNATVSVTGWFNKYIGLQAEGGYFSGQGEHSIYNQQTATPCTGASCNQLVYTAEGGPVLRFPLGAFVPFIHTLGGGARINGPVAQPLFWGWGVTGGGGLDIVLPPFHHRIAFRAIQADWQYSQVLYGPLVLPAGTHGGFGELDALKVSSGLVFKFGDAQGKAPVQLGCTVDPIGGYPGDPLKITGTTINTDPKLKPTITWTTTGGKVTGEGLYPTLDTTGVAPGDYIVHGMYREGLKARQQAICEAAFTVKEFQPPTISCTATPNVANSGTDIAISTSGGSPQNRPVTYSYSASEGQIAGNGPTAVLSTAGLSPTTITVNCNIVDDLGKSAKATTEVKITAPPAPVVPSTQPLCTLAFLRDKRRPARVDNEAKGCLDDIALTLNKQTDARLVIVGNYLAPEAQDIAAQRTLNARQYLAQEKGIDPSRIELRIGDASGKTATNTLVPAGAIFNEVGTHVFDASTIVRKGPAYGIARKTPAGAKAGAAKPAARKAGTRKAGTRKAGTRKAGTRHHGAASGAPVVNPGVAPVTVAPAAADPTPAKQPTSKPESKPTGLPPGR